MKMIPSRTRSLALASVRSGAPLITLAILMGAAGLGGPQTADRTAVVRARFEPSGKVLRPSDYRQWVHVGTRVKVGGLNILDGKELTTPQILNAYVEPSAMAAYRKTGKWPDGTQIVKEISSIKTGTGCEQATNVCTTQFGAGLFEDSYSGLGMMVKDSRRYASLPGNWGYFSFLPKGHSFDETASERGAEGCAACHIKLASDTDYVIARAHLALSPQN